MMPARKWISVRRATFGVAAAALAWSAAPALAAPPETPETKPATAITGTKAVLAGVLNPKAKVNTKTGWYFAYSSEAGCTGGLTSSLEPEAQVKAQTEHKEVTGLTPSKSYSFCLVATNASGETPAPALTFKTLAVAPSVETESVTGITPFAATLQAEVNPENQPTTGCRFEYGETETYGNEGACEPASMEGAKAQVVSLPVSGLKAGTTYHYRVVVKNAAGETKGADGELETLTANAPTVISQNSSGVSSTDATLEATINPEYQETTYSFEYATNEAITENKRTVAGANPLPAAHEELIASPTDIGGGLTPGTTYYWRVTATNATGTTNGSPVQHFTTPARPDVVTGTSQAVTRTTAAVSGTVNPAGAATSYHFAIIDQAGYQAALAESAANAYADGRTTPVLDVCFGVVTVCSNSDSTAHMVGPLTVGELSPGTTYHYALVAANAVGMTIGADQSFTTSPPTPPIVATGEAVGVTQLAATITGAVDSSGMQTTFAFEFGTTPGSGSLLPASEIPGSGSGSTVDISIAFGNNLQPGVTYYYRAVATNADGTGYGAEKSFTTGTFPSAITMPGSPAFIPFTTLAELTAKETPKTKGYRIAKATNAQKLATALKACHKKPKRKRARCEKQARRRYAAARR
jgi:hypothetical protein